MLDTIIVTNQSAQHGKPMGCSSRSRRGVQTRTRTQIARNQHHRQHQHPLTALPPRRSRVLYLPDHTIPGYMLAIEPDLVSIEDAHAVGLKVHSWTMQDENYRLAVNYSGNATLEYLELFDMGIDGLFTDNCKTAVSARDAWQHRF